MYIDICREGVFSGIGPRVFEEGGGGDSMDTSPERPRLTRDVRLWRKGVIARSPAKGVGIIYRYEYIYTYIYTYIYICT